LWVKAIIGIAFFKISLSFLSNLNLDLCCSSANMKNIELIVTFLFCIVDLEGQQKIAFLEIYVSAMNIFDQNFVAKFE
jgi:hypothetical protein